FCPPKGLAFFDPSDRRMYFGAGKVAEDVTAHELTHGVTAAESGLLYENASGAINESFSDVWGEFVQLENNPGPASIRWLIGEDLQAGGLRSMKNPPLFNHPDRLGSPLYRPPVQVPDNSNDDGWVHFNSGINNKLCYLLTDGDSFNGYTVTGMGISRV